MKDTVLSTPGTVLHKLIKEVIQLEKDIKSEDVLKFMQDAKELFETTAIYIDEIDHYVTYELPDDMFIKRLTNKLTKRSYVK